MSGRDCRSTLLDSVIKGMNGSTREIGDHRCRISALVFPVSRESITLV